jgi:hypothetical protein
MSDEFSAAEESVREVLASLRTERVMSEEGCLQVYRHHRREECKPPHRLLEQEHPEPAQKKNQT